VERPMRLLLVEDDAVDALAIRRALARADIEVELTHLGDAQEALDQLRAGVRPDALLVDLNTPRLSGLELLRALRADRALVDQIVFVYTTSRDPADVRGAYACQVAGYFVKSAAPDADDLVVRALTAWWTAVHLADQP
jgi:DNA-binding NarL/FixJ family response regulator